MLENQMVTDYIDYDFNTDKYDREMEALAERDDREWEDYNND